MCATTDERRVRLKEAHKQAHAYGSGATAKQKADLGRMLQAETGAYFADDYSPFNEPSCRCHLPNGQGYGPLPVPPDGWKEVLA